MDNLAPWLHASIQQIQALKHNSSLSHALLVTGAQGVGQEILAQHVAADLMCQNAAKACGQCHSCQLMMAMSHPDFHYLNGEEGAIKVDNIRDLVRKINQKAQVGHSKVVLISCAHNMNINASNAVLKALEEPADNTYFILTTSYSSTLLATIRSRCLLVNLPTPSRQEVENWLINQSDQAEIRTLFWLTTQPYQLLALQKANKVELYSQLLINLTNFLQGNTSVEEVVKKCDSKTIADYCDGLLAILHGALLHTTGAPLDPTLSEVFQAMMTKMSVRALMQRYDAIQKLKQDLQKTNLNPHIQLIHELNQW
ncbi:DNA polymerase III subunit delta' [Marinomonas epiphytica]